MEHTEDAGGCQFSERFLQILWNEQRFCDGLQTVSGARLEVISPGTWNVAGGPDFRNAAVRIGGVLLRGDVEVHRSSADWARHGHGGDPAYGDVVLHVVWERPRGDGPFPVPHTFAVSEHLDRPWRALFNELRAAHYPYARQVSPGTCAMRWALADDGSVHRVLTLAGLARFEERAFRLRRRIVAVGPDQALYEAVFEALGYRANRVPFRELARQVPLPFLRELGSRPRREAYLFGKAGLLPDPTVRSGASPSGERLRVLWDEWWGIGDSALALAWCRGGSRPQNTPERRLAAGLAFLENSGLSPASAVGIRVLSAQGNAASAAAALRGLFDDDGPWCASRDFFTPARPPCRLVGSSRANDILANVVLPFLHAREDGDASGDNHPACEVYRQLPRLQDNRLFREAAHRLFVPPARARDVATGACTQLGLLELYTGFCLAVHGACENCPLAEHGSVADLSEAQYS